MKKKERKNKKQKNKNPVGLLGRSKEIQANQGEEMWRSRETGEERVMSLRGPKEERTPIL